MVAGRDLDYAELRAKHIDAAGAGRLARVERASYILYTSGTTGKPKGVQRDVGGLLRWRSPLDETHLRGAAGRDHVHHLGHRLGGRALLHHLRAAHRRHDLHHVRGHAYPAGTRASGGRSCRTNKVSGDVFSAPTAIRAEKQDPALPEEVRRLEPQAPVLAGEPLDEPTHTWITEALGRPVSTITGRPKPAGPSLSSVPGVEKTPIRWAAQLPCFSATTSSCCASPTPPTAAATRRGVVAIAPRCRLAACPRVGRRPAFRADLLHHVQQQAGVYDLDWGIPTGTAILHPRAHRRVINVAGHRLGTREIEEAVAAHANVAEVAVVGVVDQIHRADALAFAVVKDGSKPLRPRAVPRRRGNHATVDSSLGRNRAPVACYTRHRAAKTALGQLLRRSIQALAEGRDPGDLTPSRTRPRWSRSGPRSPGIDPTRGSVK